MADPGDLTETSEDSVRRNEVEDEAQVCILASTVDEMIAAAEYGLCGGVERAYDTLRLIQRLLIAEQKASRG